MPTTKTKRYRALTNLSLWKVPDVRPDPFDDPAQWLDWKAGDVFTPPPHMNIARCLERGVVEEVNGG
mgnify:CR=1 FL=1